MPTFAVALFDLLKTARAISARSINAVMTATYWEIGRRIVESEMRGKKRADYGERLVERLAVDLSEQFGRGFGKINLWRMWAFFRAWPEKQILSTPLKESGASASLNEIGSSLLINVPTLSAMFPLLWSAYLRLLAVRREEARKFYETEAIRAGWSVCQLDRPIGSQFYERIALSRNKAAMLENAETPELGDGSRLKKPSKIRSFSNFSPSRMNTPNRILEKVIAAGTDRKGDQCQQQPQEIAS